MTPDDRLAIHGLLAAYCQAYDDHDEAGLGAVFAPDAAMVVRAGTEQILRGREQVLAWLVGGWSNELVSLHLTGNIRVERDGDGAKGRTDYVFAVRGDDGIELRQAGRYLDRFVQVEGRWCIGARTITVLPAAR